MSGVRIEGRGVSPRIALEALEARGREALREATTHEVLPAARDEAPGQLGEALTVSVRKTSEGVRATVQASPRKVYRGGPATGAKVVRWVTRGTGVYRAGPGPKRPITSKRGVLGTMVLPGGQRVRSVRGQHPNPFLARADERTRDAVTRTLREGVARAARDLQDR